MADTRFQEASHKVAERFIELYTNPAVSMEEIAAEMGWNTKNPRQMVQTKKRRLRDMGYDIPDRQQHYGVEKPTQQGAQSRLDTVVNALRKQGYDVIHDDEGRLVVVPL